MLQMESQLRATESELEEEKEEFEHEAGEHEALLEEKDLVILEMEAKLHETEQVLVCRALFLLCELSLRCVVPLQALEEERSETDELRVYSGSNSNHSE